MQQKISQKNLGGMMDAEIVDAFTNQADTRGQIKKSALAAAVRLWTSLPEEIQARLMNRSLSETAFIELINQMLDTRIQEGRKDGQALARRQKSKQRQKG